MGFTDETVRFNLDDGSKDEISNTLTNVYRSLAEKGYNPTDNFFINHFFENNKRKPPYTFINIDTKEYNIIVNE